MASSKLSRGILLAGLIVGLAFTTIAQAATFCVSTAGELSTALGTAASNSEDDTVRIVQGTYFGNFVCSAWQANALTIEGGYTSGCATRVVNPANTVLDGQQLDTVLSLEKSNMVGSGRILANFSVDGLTLQNGSGGGAFGGGLYANTDGNITLTNNVIRDNAATGTDVPSWVSASGGGIYAFGHLVTLSHNVISGNTAPRGSGGGLYFEQRGGDSPDITVTLTNNTINDNTASGVGGGVRVDRAAITLTSNTISGNTASDGGGLDVSNLGFGPGPGTGMVALINNVIDGNTANHWGGGVSFAGESGASLTLINNTIIDNAAGTGGGGLALQLGAALPLSDKADIYDNIIWNNAAMQSADLYLDNRSPVNLFHNDFDQSAAGFFATHPFPIDPSNLNNLNPLFVDAAAGDYHLTVGSPCIDAGDNSAPALPPTDKDGNVRTADGVVDMGAYEYQGEPALLPRRGMWWNPARSGHGIDLQMSGGVVFITWFTYEQNGTPTWYLASAPLTGTHWEAPLDRYTWDATTRTTTRMTVGTITMDFTDATHGTLSWTLNGQPGSEPFEYFLVDSTPPVVNYTGHWFVLIDPGWGLTLNMQGPFEFGVLYFYDAAGEPRWALGSKANLTDPTIPMDSYLGFCPNCPWVPTQVTPIGTLTRSFQDARNGTLSTDLTLMPPLSGDWLIDNAAMTLLSDPVP